MGRDQIHGEVRRGTEQREGRGQFVSKPWAFVGGSPLSGALGPDHPTVGWVCKGVLEDRMGLSGIVPSGGGDEDVFPRLQNRQRPHQIGDGLDDTVRVVREGHPNARPRGWWANRDHGTRDRFGATGLSGPTEDGVVAAFRTREHHDHSRDHPAGGNPFPIQGVPHPSGAPPSVEFTDWHRAKRLASGERLFRGRFLTARDLGPEHLGIVIIALADEPRDVQKRASQVGGGIEEVHQVAAAEDVAVLRGFLDPGEPGWRSILETFDLALGTFEVRGPVRACLVLHVLGGDPNDVPGVELAPTVASPKALDHRRPRREVAQEETRGDIHPGLHDLGRDRDGALGTWLLQQVPQMRLAVRGPEAGMDQDQARTRTGLSESLEDGLSPRDRVQDGEGQRSFRVVFQEIVRLGLAVLGGVKVGPCDGFSRVQTRPKDGSGGNLRRGQGQGVARGVQRAVKVHGPKPRRIERGTHPGGLDGGDGPEHPAERLELGARGEPVAHQLHLVHHPQTVAVEQAEVHRPAESRQGVATIEGT